MDCFFITGQTATGKTRLAFDLAKKHGGEIINCDSRQIYKKLDIVTGKDLQYTTGEFHLSTRLDKFDIGYYLLKKNIEIKLWLYDIVDPETGFSAFDYKNCCLHVITDILKRGKTPIVVGGTYFYLKNLLYDTVQTRIEPNPKLREKLMKVKIEELQSRLIKLDSTLFENLNNSEKNNTHRLIRKIEILMSNGAKSMDNSRKMSEYFSKMKIQFIGLRHSSKENLINSIQMRVGERLKKGAVEEVKNLVATKTNLFAPGLKSIGYHELLDYIYQKITLEKLLDIWITKEVQYAKRQFTFMKSDTLIEWKIV